VGGPTADGDPGRVIEGEVVGGEVVGGGVAGDQPHR
jgi:hypothetical protein